ncbi:MAG TPA: hypothetical protein ENL08_00220 [Bacteroidetes bacterium]|nr:hypothetical protein [Bacteroidota bacterium]
MSERPLGWVFLLATTLLLANCDWDPAHDHILDPDNPQSRPFGSLRLTVLTLDQHPVNNAYAQIKEVGRFGTTDTSGVVCFYDLPEGEWWVVAYRNSVPDTVYAPDSVQVTIRHFTRTDTNLQLDAVPSFINVTVNSITQAVNIDSNYIYARLTARVFDPDGITDLDRVEWKLRDLRNNILMHDTLDHYDPDSAYWWEEIPSGEFPGGNLINTFTTPFIFESYDHAGNSSQSTAYLARIIYRPPELRAVVQSGPKPTLRWNYSWSLEFPVPESFYYLVSIYEVPSETLVYRRQLIPDGSGEISHTVEDSLEIAGTYRWDVWVFDLFGNNARSLRNGFVVG